AEQRYTKQGRCDRRAEQRLNEGMRLIEFRDVVLTDLVKSGRSKDQDRGVDQQCEHQSEGGIERRKLDRFAPVLDACPETARLHDARMQVKIMRHNRSAENAKCEIEHLRVG